MTVLDQIKKDHLKPSVDKEFLQKNLLKLIKNSLSLNQSKTIYSGHKTY